MAGSGDLFLALKELKAVAEAALADTPGGLPDCRYIADGPPAWDACPCLVLYAGGPSVGDTFPLQPALEPLHRIARNGMVNLVTLNVLALRCSPTLGDEGTPSLPTPAEWDEAAERVYGDAWALWNHIAAAKRSLALFPPKEREFSLEPGIAVNPQGGAAGSMITVRVQLDGYTPS